MKLNKPLDETFRFGEEEFNVDLAFDNILDVFDVLNDDELRQGEKIKICLALLLGDQDYIPSVDMWNHIYETFIHVEEKEHVEYDLKGNPMPKEEEEDNVKLIDLEVDAEHIYASFRQAYNINLFEEQTVMKWREFQSLLNGLPQETIMQRIIQIRSWKTSKGDSSEYIKSMKKLQKAYSLESEVEE